MAESATAAGWDARNHAGFVRFLGAIVAGSPAARLYRRGGVVASIAPAAPERSLFNSVSYESPGDLEPAVLELADLYAAAGVRAWTVWVPESDARSAELLAARGHLLDAQPRAMAVEIAGADLEGPRGFAYTASVRWPELCAVNDVAYGLPAGTFERGLGADPDPGFRAYGVSEGGMLVSVLATLEHEGDCVVFAVATLPEAQGRGLAGRLLGAALLEAAGRGCSTSTLQATAAGAPVYGRLGYRDLGAVQMWERRRDAADPH